MQRFQCTGNSIDEESGPKHSEGELQLKHSTFVHN